MCCPGDGAELILYEVSAERDDVLEGVLECSTCGDLWTIVHAIPRFIDVSSVDLALDRAFVNRNRDTLRRIKPELAGRIVEKLDDLASQSGRAEHEWNRDEMEFWEKYYENRYQNDLRNRTT